MITIGIIGHRDLSKKKTCQYKQNIHRLLKNMQVKYKKIKLISPLADGADRLVIYQGLKLNIDFEVILPMDKCEYKKDFNFYSKKEFDRLLKRSNSITTLSYKGDVSRNFMYEAAGKYISNNCDILLAVWDGKYNLLKGGTSEIIKYHIKQNRKLIHLKVDRNNI